MDKSKLTLVLAFLSLGLLLVGTLVASYMDPTTGVIMRWLGVAVGVAYFVLRSKLRKEQE